MSTPEAKGERASTSAAGIGKRASPPGTGTGKRWRAFPWDEGSKPGTRFSPSFVPTPTGRGRFDIPRQLSSSLYLAESPEHAVGELIQPWRGRRIGVPHLERAGFRLALVEVTCSPEVQSNLFDLCDPSMLEAGDMAPDRTASRHRHITQPLARKIWDTGAVGLRWWSSVWGDWHTTVLFTARTEGHLDFGDPVPLTPAHPTVQKAACLLGIRVSV